MQLEWPDFLLMERGREQTMSFKKEITTPELLMKLGHTTTVKQLESSQER